MNDGSKEVVLSDEFINTIWIFFKSKLSKRTQQEYFAVIKSFVKITGKDPLKITQQACEQYVTYLRTRMESNRLSYTTALMRVSVMRTLCEYIKYTMNEKGYDYINYFNDISLPDIDKTLKEDMLPSTDELNNLLELTKNNSDSMAFLIFSLIIKCGLTSSEISNLNIEYIGL